MNPERPERPERPEPQPAKRARARAPAEEADCPVAAALRALVGEHLRGDPAYLLEIPRPALAVLANVPADEITDAALARALASPPVIDLTVSDSEEQEEGECFLCMEGFPGGAPRVSLCRGCRGKPVHVACAFRAVEWDLQCPTSRARDCTVFGVSAALLRAPEPEPEPIDLRTIFGVSEHEHEHDPINLRFRTAREVLAFDLPLPAPDPRRRGRRRARPLPAPVLV